jgi:putative FmdB family regulatory protein
MPVFEYECDVCGKRFELRRHYGDPHPSTCPDGHESVHRVFAPPTIIFKGSGFYVTDNGRNGRVSQRHSKDQESKSDKQESTVKDKEGASA